MDRVHVSDFRYIIPAPYGPVNSPHGDVDNLSSRTKTWAVQADVH